MSTDVQAPAARFPRFVRTAAPDDTIASLDALRAAARAEGYAAGAAEARAAVQAAMGPRLEAAVAALDGAARALATTREALAAAVAARLPDVVLRLARAVIDGALVTDGARVRAVATAVAGRLAGTTVRVVVRVPAEVATALEAWRREQGGDVAAVVVEADPALRSGDWLIDTDDAVVDGRLDTQLAEAARLLAGPAA